MGKKNSINKGKILEKINKFGDLIYRKRFWIAAVLFILLVLFQVSNSSIGMYDLYIQPNISKWNYSPIFGDAQGIRSDEWNVTTVAQISQTIDVDRFAYYNDNIRGTSTDMFSVLSTPVLDIMILAKPFNIGYLFLGPGMGLAFFTSGKIIAAFLICFEFFMLLTNKKKMYSLLGTILILFSAATQWWTMYDFYIYSFLALILFDKFLTTDKLRTKILCALGITLSALGFIFILYPSWQVPFAYIILGLAIWIIIKNCKTYRFNKKDLIVIVCAILILGMFGLRYLMLSKNTLNTISNTAYPGARFETGGGIARTVSLAYIFSYVYSIRFAYSENAMNYSEASSMLSLFPVPMIVAIVFLIRNKERKEHFKFLLPMLIISTLFTLWILVTFPHFLAKITLLYMVQPQRIIIPLGVIHILMIIYLISHVKEEDKLFNKLISLGVTVFFAVGIYYYTTKFNIVDAYGAHQARDFVLGLILFFEFYFMFTINKEESKKYLTALLMTVAIVTGIRVNPVQIGIDVITDKPVSKEIQKIVNEDKDNNLWIGEIWPNYLIANGARVVNSTNIYPNFELWKVLLDDQYENPEYENLYNRYSHIAMSVTDGETQVNAIQNDMCEVKISFEDIKELGIRYVLTSRDIEDYSNDEMKFENLYSEDGLSIYRINY